MKPWKWRPATAAVALLGVIATAYGAEEFTFDASQFQKKPFEFGGYIELKHDTFSLNQGSAFYNLNFLRQPQRSTLDRTTATFKPSAKIRAGIATLSLRAHMDYVDDNFGSEQTNRFDELYVSLKPDPSFTFEAGKIVLKWGKGYAWNPVAFFERTKDPNDPELAREGFSIVSADLIRNFDGPLQAMALTPVLLPTTNGLNSDFGSPGHLNAGAKLYLLYRDTDIDFVFAGNGSFSQRYGVDFSRNLGSNLEIHGEWARVANFAQRITSALGDVTTRSGDATSYLLGGRYLTANDTTYIAEYYRNGAGFTEQQVTDFFELVENGLNPIQSIAGAALLRKAIEAAQSGYGRPNPGRHYAYVRVSQKEPFDILYFTPALTTIVNLDDRSFSITPELFYTGINNLELRLRAVFLVGVDNTEFGEKANSRRLELQARLYF